MTPRHDRLPSAPRSSFWRSAIAVAAALGVGACPQDQRPTGLLDGGAPDIVLPDIVASDGGAEAGMDAGADAGTDAGRDGGADADGAAKDGGADVFVPDGPFEECCADASVRAARNIAPRSGGYVSSRRPVFRWTPQDGAAMYRVEVGVDRAFSMTAATFVTTDASTVLGASAELPSGRHWWRVVPLRDDRSEMTPTAAWPVRVGQVPNDLNADGFADIVVGAPEHDGASLADIGRVQVFFGGAALDATSDVTLDGSAAGEGFGRSVSTSGDVNGDGYADLAIGAPFAGPMEVGRVVVYLGGATISTAPVVSVTGTQASAQFGRNVSIAGDLNGDGFDDLLVTTPFFRGAPGANAGHAWVFFGGSPMDSVADVQFDYASGGDQLGYSSAPAGDVNGDGFLDIVVGAPRNGVAGIDSGAGYVWWGGSPMDTGVDVIFLGTAPGGRLGDAVAGLGDFNSDGYADVALGAPGTGTGGPNAGAVFGFAGSPGVIPRPLFTISGASSERLGTAVAGGGDLDADGFDDLVAGARDNSAGGALSGRAYVYRGTAGLAPVIGATYSVSSGGAGGGDEFGYAVGVLGDANADGFDEILVGAPSAPFMGTAGPGRLFLFAGGNALATTPRQTYVPAAAGAFGQAFGRR